LAGCGASGGDDGSGAGADGGAATCEKVAETEVNCGDGKDDNCDGKIDCENSECAFDDACTGGGNVEGCGEATHAGDALAIPDGVGMSYETSINITGFDDGQVLQSADGFISACVTMEHSWLRDLQIELICPSGELIILQEFLGTTGSELYMGMPNDNDGMDPTPGVGAEYCWSATASNADMLQWANSNPGVGVLPAGDYRPVTSYDELVGCTLNGDWTIRATDDWGSDNGYIFEWSVNFNQDIISDCGEWID
jgi:hypothetical protein